jgi:pimeloyl-ACP methyl ester carboxylesterase
VLAAWLDTVGLPCAHLVGHSLGASMAIRLAATHPERVRRLVLVDAAGLLHGTGLLDLTARAIGPAPERTLEFRRLVMADVLRTNPFVVLQTAREMVRDDLAHTLDRVATPTLIIWGGRDRVVPVDHAYVLRDRIAGSRLLVIPQAGHNPMYYHAGTFNRVVAEFLAGQ